MKRPIVGRKYLIIDWTHRPDGRRYRFRHQRRVHSIYIQILRLEIVVWYR